MGNTGGYRANPSPTCPSRSMCDPRDLNRRGASAVAGPRDHREHNALQRGTHVYLALPFFLKRAVCALLLAPLPRYVSLYSLFVFTHSQHVCANVCFENSSTSSLSSSSEKDRRSVEPFLWGEEPRASDLRKRALDLMGKEEDRGSPFLIFPSNPSASTTTAPPQRQRGRCCEDAGENSLLKESPPPPPWEWSIRSGSHS